MAMTVDDMIAELKRVSDAGRGSVPVFIGDYEPVGVLWIEDDSTQVFEPEKANGFLVEYA